MLKKSRKELKTISLKLSELRDNLTEIRFNEEERFEGISNSAWESYKVQNELAPCGDIDEAICSIETAMEALRCALEG